MNRTNSESNRKVDSRSLCDSNSSRPHKAGAKSTSPLSQPSKGRTYTQTDDPVLLKRSEEVFNAQSAS